MRRGTGVSARVRRYAGSYSERVHEANNDHALFGVSLFPGFDRLH